MNVLISHIQGYVVHGILPPEGVTDDDADGGRHDMSCFGECYVYLLWVADGIFFVRPIA